MLVPRQQLSAGTHQQITEHNMKKITWLPSGKPTNSRGRGKSGMTRVEQWISLPCDSPMVQAG